MIPLFYSCRHPVVMFGSQSARFREKKPALQTERIAAARRAAVKMARK
jgi:hypothetical protein